MHPEHDAAQIALKVATSKPLPAQNNVTQETTHNLPKSHASQMCLAQACVYNLDYLAAEDTNVEQ